MAMLYECEACKEGRHDECEVGHKSPAGDFWCTCCGLKGQDKGKPPLRSFLESPWLEKISKLMKEGEEQRLARITSNPDNGKTGWWVVDGVRHSAYARASSAAEAIEKADKAKLVDASWESPEARFWCEELPDVF